MGHKRPAEAQPLGSRTFDDHFALARDRRLGLEGGGHSLRVLFDRNYGYAQVYAPADQNFVALEPMTAPVDALVSGTCPFVSPGQTVHGPVLDHHRLTDAGSRDPGHGCGRPVGSQPHADEQGAPMAEPESISQTPEWQALVAHHARDRRRPPPRAVRRRPDPGRHA